VDDGRQAKVTSTFKQSGKEQTGTSSQKNKMGRRNQQPGVRLSPGSKNLNVSK
jgi:hypothetical protein